MLGVVLALLLHSCQPEPAFANPCLGSCTISDQGYQFIEKFEGFSPFVYYDTGGVATVGFGHAIRPGDDIHTPLMGPDALLLLKKDVNERVPQINRLIKVPLFQPQFDALTSFSYNVGVGSLRRSTLLKRVNAGQPREVHPCFLVWDKIDKKPSKGLRIRREEEANLYDSGIK
jgi:lysozyme